jgi:hypothetical protein
VTFSSDQVAFELYDSTRNVDRKRMESFLYESLKVGSKNSVQGFVQELNATPFGFAGEVGQEVRSGLEGQVR